MPAIITHNFFGQEVYHDLHTTIGETRDEYEAFLLGNQGPDPLFYALVNPLLHEFKDLGSILHSEKPNELLVAMRQGLEILSPDEYPIARAYMLGFICHYTLDSAMHPLVYATEYALCDAGVEGFTRADGHEVHSMIESDLDEMVLFSKTGKTIASFNPSKEILNASDFVLETISKLYVYVAMTVYGLFIPSDLFESTAKNFRKAQGLFYSPSGTKRALVGRFEKLFRRYSFFKSISHRPAESTESQFDNHEHAVWESPFTEETSTKGFWDIYKESHARARSNIELINSATFGLDEAREITNDLDFSGKPTAAILIVEDTPEAPNATALSTEETG